MNRTFESLIGLLTAIGRHRSGTKPIEQALGSGAMRDLLEAGGGDPENRHLWRESLGLLPFRVAPDYLLNGVGVMHQREFLRGEGKHHFGSAAWATLKVSENRRGFAKPELRNRPAARGAVYDKLKKPGKGEHPEKWLEEYRRAMRLDGFAPADVIDLARMNGAESAQKTNALFVAPDSVPIVGTPGQFFFVLTPCGTGTSDWRNVIELKSAGEIADLFSRGKKDIRLLGAPTGRDG